MPNTPHILNCHFRPGLAYDPRCPRCREQWEEKSTRLGWVADRERIRALGKILARPAVWDALHPHERADVSRLVLGFI